MRRVLSGRLTVASLNTRGVPMTGSGLARRYAVIGAGFDAGDADVVCFQEVFTYWHLRLLAWGMRSFGQVSYWRAPAGPAGGLVTFSRLPVSSTVYRRFGLPPRVRRVPWSANVDRESSLFGRFMEETGLADAFTGVCPPTFRAEYLQAGGTPRCIDFILTGDGVTTQTAALVFAGKEPLAPAPGYVSEHMELRARLSVAPP